MVNAPTTTYTEAQIDEDSISLTLITESQEGVRIEDTERFTFEELQDMAGEHLTLSLSDESRGAMSGSRKSALSEIRQADTLADKAQAMPEKPDADELLAYMGMDEFDLPQEGQWMADQNPPSWSQDDRVQVINVTEIPAKDYVIQQSEFGRDKTVADANPGEPEDAPVVEAVYLTGSDKEYAFPVTRLQDT